MKWKIQNQALALSHAILEDLPVPIIGVSTELMIVLINKAAHKVITGNSDRQAGFGLHFRRLRKENHRGDVIRYCRKPSPELSWEPALRNIDMTPLSGRFAGKGAVLTVKARAAG